jgi:assimilatory nitrate reductase catalytic subunit
MTRNIGRPGTGANSITGQCNAMGSRLFSNTTNLLGGRDFTKEKDRQDVAKILDIPVERIPDRNSWAYNEIMDGIDAGRIKGLWVIATNTAHSWINQNSIAELRKKLDFLVVQDMYASTETALMADLMLPAAAWGEKEGTFINSERRIGVTKKVSKAPGQALTDFNIVKLISHYWGCGEMFKRWESPEATFQIMKELSKGQPCDITGIQDYKMIDDSGGVQWPCASPELAQEQQRRLFADGQFFTPTKRAKFIYEAPRSMPESPSAAYPFLLLTGRGTASQWHTQTRTKKSKILQKLYPALVYVEIHPADAERLSISANTDVTIASARGSITAKAVITGLIQPGQVFLPMHYEMVNQLTHPSFDTYSKQPNYKACAVNVTRA